MVGNSPDEGAIFHCIDVLQAFVDRRKGGETGVKAVQSIRGPETWAWVERNAWAGNLLQAVGNKFDLKVGYFQERRKPNVCVVEYNGNQSGRHFGRGCGLDLRRRNRRPERADHCLNAWVPGPISQYHAANAYEHWIVEMMRTGKEPFNAERLLLSTGIVNYYMDSNWENGRYSAVGRRIETRFLNMKYRSTHGPLFETGPRPPNTPYIRGFTS